MMAALLPWSLAVVLGAVLGGWLGGGAGAWPGAVAGALLLHLVDALAGGRVLRWLRRSPEQPLPEPPRSWGRWREAAERMRRHLRQERQLRQEAQASLEAFLSAIQASPNGVLLLDAQGRIQWMNSAACAHLGLHAQRDQLQHVAHLVRDPQFTAYLQAHLAPGESATEGWASGITLVRQADAQRALRLQLHPYGAGQLLLLSQDVTAMAAAEAMQRQFVANVSHEIRTPLTVLAGFIETMQTLPLDEAERARYLDLMARQAARQKALVDDLLTLSRLEGPMRPGHDAVFEAMALLADCELEARSLSAQLYVGEAAQQLQFEGEPDLFIVGERHEWHSACTNLLHNAIRHGGPGARIVAQWRRLPDGQAEFAVSDTGPGIAPEHLGHLTERFYRVDGSRSRESGGTGLGLAITRQVAQRHEGELLIDSTLGQGSRFALRVPAARVRRNMAGAGPDSAPA